VHTPGAVSSYSNYGAALAGEAISYVASKPFERYIEDAILRPAGLSRTTFREPHPPKAGIPAPMAPALAADLARPYRWTPAGFEARDFEYVGHIAPAGSASSTAADMARYMQLLLNGGTIDGAVIYGPRAAQAFRTPIRRTPAGVNGWRHGFIAYALPSGYTGFGHNGATLSFMSNMVVIPELNLGIFVSTNTETGGELSARLPGQIVQQFYAPRPPARTGSPALADEANLYEGYYVGTRRAYGGLEGFVDLLISGMDVDVTAKGVLTTSHRGDTRRWVPEGDDARAGRFISMEDADHLVFDVRSGRGERIFGAMGGQTFERAPFWKRPMVLAVMAGLTALAALATVGGVFLRNRREFRETPIQRQGSLIQTSQAALWLAAFVLFAAWASNTADAAKIVYGWPGPWLLIASACVILASVLSVVVLILLPAIWRGGRRVDSWTALRKAAFSFTTLLYMAFSALLFGWGALSPWS
jgi:CubicO group peptidase (beta-lactamase class C family)